MAESSFQFETLLNGRYPSAVLHLGVGYSLDFKTLSFRSDVFAKGPRSRFFKSTFSVVFRINWRTGSTLEFETLSSIGRFCVGACKRFAVLHWRVVYSLEFETLSLLIWRFCERARKRFFKSKFPAAFRKICIFGDFVEIRLKFPHIQKHDFGGESVSFGLCETTLQGRRRLRLVPFYCPGDGPGILRNYRLNFRCELTKPPRV